MGKYKNISSLMHIQNKVASEAILKMTLRGSHIENDASWNPRGVKRCIMG